MATYHGMYRSNAVPVTDDPTELLDATELPEGSDEPEDAVPVYQLDGSMYYDEEAETLFLGSTGTTFAVWDYAYTQERTEQFLNELSAVIEEPLTIRSIGYTKLRHVPDAYQWVVYPDGRVEVESLEVVGE